MNVKKVTRVYCATGPSRNDFFEEPRNGLPPEEVARDMLASITGAYAVLCCVRPVITVGGHEYFGAPEPEGPRFIRAPDDNGTIVVIVPDRINGGHKCYLRTCQSGDVPIKLN